MLEHAQRWQPQQAQLLRRCALFVAFLLSGGNPLIPREPLAALLVILCFLIGGARMGLRREMAGIGVLMLAMLSIAIIGSGEFLTETTIIRAVNFTLALFLLGIYIELPKSAFVDDIIPILKISAYQAVITVVLATFIPAIFTPVLYIDAYYNHFAYILWYHEVGADTGFFKRPDNFFHEAGVLQIYMNILLFIGLFVKKNKTTIAVGAIGVLSTQSTIGLAIASVLVAWWYLENLKNVSFPVKLLVTTLSPVLVVPMFLILASNFETKFTGDLRGSAWARQYDLVTGLNIAVANPVIGIGFDYTRYYDESLIHGDKTTQLDESSTVRRANTNGVIQVLYTVGFPLGLMLVYFLFRQKFFERKVIFSLIIIGSLTGQTLFYTPFFLMFVYSGLLLSPKSKRSRSLTKSLALSKSY